MSRQEIVKNPLVHSTHLHHMTDARHAVTYTLGGTTMRRTLLLSLLVVVLLLTGCGGGGGPDRVAELAQKAEDERVARGQAPAEPEPEAEPEPTPEAVTPTEPTEAPEPPPSPSPVPIAACDTADANVVALVDAGLTDAEVSLDPGTAVVVQEGGRVYLGADILDAEGGRHSSQDVWIVEAGQVWALSGSAREETLFPDGRDLPDGPSAGSGGGRAVQECMTAGLRASVAERLAATPELSPEPPAEPEPEPAEEPYDHECPDGTWKPDAADCPGLGYEPDPNDGEGGVPGAIDTAPGYDPDDDGDAADMTPEEVDAAQAEIDAAIEDALAECAADATGDAPAGC